jgi:hypothetical protein
MEPGADSIWQNVPQGRAFLFFAIAGHIGIRLEKRLDIWKS